jgi:hypothetical protein
MAPAWKVGWVQALGGSNPPFSASNSLDLEPEKALLRGSFCLIVQVCVQMVTRFALVSAQVLDDLLASMWIAEPDLPLLSGFPKILCCLDLQTRPETGRFRIEMCISGAVTAVKQRPLRHVRGHPKLRNVVDC